MKDNKGFTLVELIVIIVILAILIGASIGAIYMYISKAKINTDKNNRKAFEDAYNAVMLNCPVYSSKYISSDHPMVWKSEEQPYVWIQVACNRTDSHNNNIYNQSFTISDDSSDASVDNSGLQVVLQHYYNKHAVDYKDGSAGKYVPKFIHSPTFLILSCFKKNGEYSGTHVVLLNTSKLKSRMSNTGVIGFTGVELTAFCKLYNKDIPATVDEATLNWAKSCILCDGGIYGNF